jgi:hypothetical protein
LAILHLASTSHSHFGLASSWADRYAKTDIQMIHELEAAGEIPKVGDSSRTGLSILCKRAAGICSVCNNRYVCTEPSTNLQVCDGCEPFYFPKISAQRLKWLYFTTELGMEATRNQKYRICYARAVRYPKTAEKIRGLGHQSFGPLYRWRDIQRLIAQQHIAEKQEGDGGSQGQRTYVGEEYGYFCAPDEKAASERYWPHTLLWGRACARWDPQLTPEDRGRLRPCFSDMILFREFRYRFDPTWSPRSPNRTVQMELDEYFQYARCWTDASLWNERPWRLCNFPHQPRCLTTTPSSSCSDWRQCMNELTFYQTQCAQIRAVLKSFPSILSMPNYWQRRTSREAEICRI